MSPAPERKLSREFLDADCYLHCYGQTKRMRSLFKGVRLCQLQIRHQSHSQSCVLPIPPRIAQHNSSNALTQYRNFESGARDVGLFLEKGHRQ